MLDGPLVSALALAGLSTTSWECLVTFTRAMNSASRLNRDLARWA